MVLAIKVLVAPHGISSYFVRPFKVWLILDLLQDLMHWFPEHNVNHLKSRRSRLLRKIPFGPAIVVAIRPEIPSLLRDNLTFPLALLLVLLDPFILIYPIHELAYTSSRFPSQRLS